VRTRVHAEYNASMGRRALIVLLGACSFDPPAAAGDVSPMDVAPTIDARDSVTEDAASDAPPGCTPGFFDLCVQAPATDPFTVTGIESFDTDLDPRCRTFDQATGPDVCLVMATSVDITGTLQVSGTRPLALASSAQLSISGELDVSSRRGGRTGPGADDGSCTMTRLPEPDEGGGGGAAGGSVGGPGGDGGIGDADSSLGGDGVALNGTAGAPISTLTYLRAGCGGARGGNEGQGGGAGGDGGRGGGGLYATAITTISITGRIRATGAGGTGGSVQAGGGGGGAGGIVILEAPSIVIDGQLSANGGGGGEGGARIGGNPVSGVAGSDGDYGTAAAAGGAGSDIRFGFGGAGAVGTTAAVAGTDTSLGGGGGGGSVGAIRLLGTRVGAGLVTPPAP